MKLRILMLATLVNYSTLFAQTVTLQSVYEENTTITADKVILPMSGVVKISHGITFILKANVLVLQSKSGTCLFDGTGDQGSHGTRPEPWTSSGPNQEWFGFGPGDVAHKDWEAAGGNANDRGGDGGDGKPGATIKIEYKTLSGTFVSSDAIKGIAPGGLPGVHGDGRKLICGSHSNEVKFGPPGNDGHQGPNGHVDITSSDQVNLIYTVSADDYLCAIATRYNSTLDNLMRANNISDKDKIYFGENLIIRPMHLISTGETLSGISKSCDRKIKSLVEANQISNPNLIYAGCRLIL